MAAERPRSKTERELYVEAMGREPPPPHAHPTAAWQWTYRLVKGRKRGDLARLEREAR